MKQRPLRFTAEKMGTGATFAARKSAPVPDFLISAGHALVAVPLTALCLDFEDSK
jgi:hypothetical protein